LLRADAHCGSLRTDFYHRVLLKRAVDDLPAIFRGAQVSVGLVLL
jgi:hypothetical protein